MAHAVSSPTSTLPLTLLSTHLYPSTHPTFHPPLPFHSPYLYHSIHPTSSPTSTIPFTLPLHLPLPFHSLHVFTYHYLSTHSMSSPTSTLPLTPCLHLPPPFHSLHVFTYFYPSTHSMSSRIPPHQQYHGSLWMPNHGSLFSVRTHIRPFSGVLVDADYWGRGAGHGVEGGLEHWGEQYGGQNKK